MSTHTLSLKQLESYFHVITHTWINWSVCMKDTGSSHVTLRIYLMHSMPTFDTLSLYIYFNCLNLHHTTHSQAVLNTWTLGSLCVTSDHHIYTTCTSTKVYTHLCTALCSSLGSLGQIVNFKKPLEISVTVYISKPQYYRARDQV